MPRIRRTWPSSPRATVVVRMLWRAGMAQAVAASVLIASAATAQRRPEPPRQLSDAEFWEMFTSMSEAGGSFPSENFVSNETSYQYVIPTLQRSLTRDGVYLGVGPEQNFTYIANLRPRLAIIFDIRRQNAMQHLMYKALFEASPTRAEFVARLFARPSVARLRSAAGLSARALFDSVRAAPPSDSAYRANADAVMETLAKRHRFALSPDDSASIAHLCAVFFEAGPDIDYGYRLGRGSGFGPGYPTYAALQAGTNADSLPMAFLATEENYRVVRDLELRNLIVPVVGDFAGPKAIRAVGEYLTKRHLTVTAFYLSNVEQYLFRSPGAADRFYMNVTTLPIDSTSTFIRSVPPNGAMGGMMVVAGGGAAAGGASGASVRVTFSIRDSAGVRVVTRVQDSAGVAVTRTTRDSIPAWVIQRDSLVRARATSADSAFAAMMRQLAVVIDSSRGGRPVPPVGPPPMFRTTIGGGLLASGLASIRATLDAAATGRLESYQDAIAMTKTGGWR